MADVSKSNNRAFTIDFKSIFYIWNYSTFFFMDFVQEPQIFT